jgi:hypothetical protein
MTFFSSCRDGNRIPKFFKTLLPQTKGGHNGTTQGGLFHIFSYLKTIVPSEFILAQLVALGALIGGICLFFLREHKRMLYALLEIAVAIITGGTAISRLKDGDLYVWVNNLFQRCSGSVRRTADLNPAHRQC